MAMLAFFGKTQWYWRDEPSLYADFQPFFNSIEFDDYGAMIIGITNRTVYTGTSAFQGGYFVRAARIILEVTHLKIWFFFSFYIKCKRCWKWWGCW
jgi:hypothetical protein